MNIEVLAVDWDDAPKLAEQFHARYGKRPVARTKTIWFIIKEGEKVISQAPYRKDVELFFPAENKRYVITEYLQVRLRLDEDSRLEMLDGITDSAYLDGVRSSANASPVLNAEMAILDKLSMTPPDLNVKLRSV